MVWLGAVVLALVAVPGCGNKKKSVPRAEPVYDAGPPSAPRYAYPPPPVLPPPPAPRGSIGRGAQPAYPTPVPLTLAPGLAPLDPPPRAQSVLAIPQRPLAVATQLVGGGPLLELIDIDRGEVMWRNETCAAPAVHATTDRIICAGWQGIAAIAVDDGKELWKSPLMYRAATERYVLGRDADDDKLGSVIDAQTGEVVAELIAPPDETFDEAKRVCPFEGGFDVYAWSKAGAFRRISYGRARGAASTGRRQWSRRLPLPPAKVDLCDPTILFEVPIPGSAARTLHAASARTGNDLTKAMDVLGWWDTDGELIEVATELGVQRRTRGLEPKDVVLSNGVAGRLVARAGALRVVRSRGDTLALIDEHGLRAWLGAPSRVDGAVVTSRRLLTAGWLSPPQSAAEYLQLFELPARTGTEPLAAAPLGPPSPTRIPEPPPQRVPPRPTTQPRSYASEGVGMHAVTHVALAGESVFAVALEARPSATRGAGVARFDLADRIWRWHSPAACAPAAQVVGVAVADDAVVCAAAENPPGRGHIGAVSRATGKPLWHIELPTVDRVVAGGSAVVATFGSVAVVLDAATGEERYRFSAADAHQPQVAVIALAGQTRVVAVERGGLLVSRNPADASVHWALAIRGYVRRLMPMHAQVGIELTSGELHLVSADGTAVALPGWSPTWTVQPGSDLVVETPEGSEGVSVLRAFGAGGEEVVRTALAITPPLFLAPHRVPGAPLAFVSHRAEGRIIEVDASAGKVRNSYRWPERMVRQGTFTSVAGGKPVVGVVLERPLAIALF
ncbi:MAG TPA: PQQ-binding-like beta-propeller repeat protein [Kofleriaceae bacterium]|nr:PQQ-binding-like beta-propeller repeat protein [Kofleriaceae bacterium]